MKDSERKKEQKKGESWGRGAYVYCTWKEDECVLAADEHQLLQLSAVCAYNTGEGAAAVNF